MRIPAVGRSSMQVEVELHTQGLREARRELCTSGRFVMIALVDLGQPTPVQGLPHEASLQPPPRQPASPLP